MESVGFSWGSAEVLLGGVGGITRRPVIIYRTVTNILQTRYSTIALIFTDMSAKSTDIFNLVDK